MNAAASTFACGAAASPVPDMVDIVFAVTGDSLPRGFEWALYREIARVIPWIAKSPRAGILPVRGTRLPDGGTMITHRSRIVVRVPQDRLCSASALEQSTLRVGGSTLTVGVGAFRKLQPAATLYSPRVAAGEADETRFLAVLEEELAVLGVNGRLICGRRVEVELEEGPATAYPVAVHNLREADSLLLLRAGLGRGQPVGCGLFIPHKTIVAAD
jgi:CRISPR-associated protein Cas6